MYLKEIYTKLRMRGRDQSRFFFQKYLRICHLLEISFSINQPLQQCKKERTTALPWTRAAVVRVNRFADSAPNIVRLARRAKRRPRPDESTPHSTYGPLDFCSGHDEICRGIVRRGTYDDRRPIYVRRRGSHRCIINAPGRQFRRAEAAADTYKCPQSRHQSGYTLPTEYIAGITFAGKCMRRTFGIGPLLTAARCRKCSQSTLLVRFFPQSRNSTRRECILFSPRNQMGAYRQEL